MRHGGMEKKMQPKRIRRKIRSFRKWVLDPFYPFPSACTLFAGKWPWGFFDLDFTPARDFGTMFGAL